MRLKPRCLMNAVDTSPGGGSPPAGGAAPGGSTTTAATPAQGPAPAAAPLDPAAFARDVAAAVGPQVRDSIFAELRKSGVLGGKPGQSATPPSGQETPPASGAAGQSAADIEALLDRRENFARELGRFDMPESALSRARQAFNAEKPSDVTTWARTYATDMGWKERAASSAAAATTTTTTTTAAAAAAAATATQPPGDSKPPAAATTAPGGGDTTPSELVDITKLSAEQRLRMGPEGIRAALDRAADAGHARDGRPRVPEVLRKKG